VSRFLSVPKSCVLSRCVFFYSAEDLRQNPRERTQRSLLARIKRARRYDKDTGEVLHIIEVSRDDKVLSLSEHLIFFCCAVYVGSALTSDPHRAKRFMVSCGCGAQMTLWGKK